MRYVWIGFHIVMLLLVIAAFNGTFDPPRTGRFAADSAAHTNIIIGVFTIWIVGAVIFRVIRKFSRY